MEQTKTREAGDDKRTDRTISAADKRSKEEMEARKMLAELGINSDQFLAKLSHHGKENQGNLDRAAQLKALEYTQGQANARNDADNAGGLERAKVMATSPVNQAKVLQGYGGAVQQGKTGEILGTGGVDPELLAQWMEIMKQMQAAPAK